MDSCGFFAPPGTPTPKKLQMNWPSFRQDLLCSRTFRKAMPPTFTSHFPGPPHQPQRALTATVAPVFRTGELRPFHLPHEDGEPRKRITFFRLLENLSKSCSENLQHMPHFQLTLPGKILRSCAFLWMESSWQSCSENRHPRPHEATTLEAWWQLSGKWLPPKRGKTHGTQKNGSEDDFPVQRTQPGNCQIPS